jgi:hypothetical protein
MYVGIVENSNYPGAVGPLIRNLRRSSSSQPG